ncbi:hypothetical protein CN120_32125, partial [Sinorhizobium meliloti]
MPWDSVGGVIMTYTMGGAGVDEGTAGAGGAVTITNYGPITLTTSTDPGSIGSLISATSFGGSGDGDNDNYKSNGGAGGSGGSLTITNYGALSVESLSPNTARGMAGIHAVSKGGTGGNQNSGAAGDQFGGVGGSGGSISITNTGQVNLGSATNPLNGLDYVWGLAAESIGQAGGHDNGAGGAGGAIQIHNGSSGGNASIGAINIYSNSADSARGIYAFSQGSYGTASQDSSDDGGAGADGGQFSIDTYSDIAVVTTGSDPNELSGGIVAISQGGDGGAGTASTTGGRGGNGSAFGSTLSVQSGVTVSTKGDYVAGVVGLAQGGRGGDGASGEKDSSGGRGGDVGAIQINVYGGSIETDGIQAYGLLGGSIGGQGGNGGDDTAVVGTSGGGGFGGNAGGVGAYVTTGSKITTTGDFSAAVTLHSIGGGGGLGGSVGQASSGDSEPLDDEGDSECASEGGNGDDGHGYCFGVSVGATIDDGGTGGTAANGNAVTLTHAGHIATAGDWADGIVAQSIGGGGGAGGTST